MTLKMQPEIQGKKKFCQWQEIKLRTDKCMTQVYEENIYSNLDAKLVAVHEGHILHVHRR